MISFENVIRMVVPSLVLLLAAAAPAAEPLALHPENPHYLVFRGKPALLVTSGEHYGAVLNRDFDYVKYLDTLADDGLNLTRTFTGAYVEPPGAFRIERNTLAPAPGRLICPWARSDQPGYAGGGNKFDLSRWDDEYFARLKDFVAQADRRGIVVELDLFCPMYDEAQWALSPMNAANNVNGVGAVKKDAVYTLDTQPELLAAQEAMVRKIVAELNGFDNLYYEICNEPYFGGVTKAWHDRITDVVVDAERPLPKKHLISWNVANDTAKIENPHPAISIFNFHYAQPSAVADNDHLDKVIGLNETGFKGTGDDYYRKQAWEFLLAGGGLYNHLDYSFTVGHEDGTFPVKDPTPGGGGPAIRRQLRRMKEFLERFDFVRMQPSRAAVKGGVPQDVPYQVLAVPGKQYAFYARDSRDLAPTFDLPAGRYAGEWLDPVSGKTVAVPAFDHPGGEKRIDGPGFPQDAALRLIAE
ncbi:MAG TPA: cellulase family glycosylhydrolase [Planctomycetaceae bacterium]